jgi:hypothetical protein
MVTRSPYVVKRFTGAFILPPCEGSLCGPAMHELGACGAASAWEEAHRSKPDSAYSLHDIRGVVN